MDEHRDSQILEGRRAGRRVRGAAYAVTAWFRLFTPRVDFILFVPAVMFATWFGGLAAGMLACALTVIAAALLLSPSEIGDQMLWVIVAGVVTLVTSAVTAVRRVAERQLAALAAAEQSRRHEAESISQLKTDLLAQVAHELRQPLSAMSVGTRLLDVTRNEIVRKQTIAVLDRQTEHLRRLVDDLLDLSKLTRHELHLRKSKFDLCQVVADSVAGFASDVATRGLDLTSTLRPCPLYVNADQTRVRQILSNLLSNAVKFTPVEGGLLSRSSRRSRPLSCGFAIPAAASRPSRCRSSSTCFAEATTSTPASASVWPS
jgi:signal transduction histidine kinase